MHDLDEYFQLKKTIGKRFKFFRQLMSKSKQDFEDEANNAEITEAHINFIEKAATLPNIAFIQYFTEEYGLNLTWLVTGSGSMFYKQGKKTPAEVFKTIQENDINSPKVNELHLLCLQNIKRQSPPKKSKPNQDIKPTNPEAVRLLWRIYDSSQR